MNKKRVFIVCTLSVLCVLLFSTKVKAIKYTDERKYIENTNVLAYEIQNNTVNRNKNFYILAKITFDKPVNINRLNKYADDLVEKAMSEELAKTSSAGDYLKFSWDEYKKSISGYYLYEYSKYNYYLKITYKFTYYTTYGQEMILDRDVKEFVENNIDFNDSNLEKVSKIYNYISNNVKYNKNIGDIKYSAYSAYENKSAICQGYSTLLYKMLKEADIENVRIIRSSTHSWNIVKIGDMYYHLDATWEATTKKKGDYNYFVSKKVRGGKTKTHIKKLNEEELLQEIARISSGTVTQVSINHAKELRKSNLKYIA